MILLHSRPKYFNINDALEAREKKDLVNTSISFEILVL